MMISIKISFLNVPNEWRRKLLGFGMRSVWVYWGDHEGFLWSKWHLNSAFTVQIIYLVLFTSAYAGALTARWFISVDFHVGEDAGSVTKSLPAMASHQPVTQGSSLRDTWHNRQLCSPSLPEDSCRTPQWAIIVFFNYCYLEWII